jgi:transposase
MSLYLKRLEAGKFIWPVSQSGSAVPVSAAQLGYLLEGIDWRNPTLDAATFESGLTACTALFLLAFQRVAW